MNYFEQKVKDYRKGALPPLVIRDKKLPHQRNTFSGIKRMSTKCITFHNSGIDGVNAAGSVNWIKNYSPENTDCVSWAGHIDYDGSIWQLAEWDDLVWASGTAPSNQYTQLSIGEYNSRPYDYDIPFEFATNVINGKEYQLNIDQLVGGALIGVKLSIDFELNRPSEGGFRRHGDFAKNKPYCPKYLMDHDNWRRFLDMAEGFYDIYKERRDM